MNIPSYNFSEEAKSDLVKFLRLAEQLKDSECNDIEKYKAYLPYFPLETNMKAELNNSNSTCHPIVDITESDDDDKQSVEIPTSTKIVPEEFQVKDDEIFLYDLVEAIKENLDTQNGLTDNVTTSVNDMPEEQLEKLFIELSNTLNLDEIINLKSSLDLMKRNKVVIKFYCRQLLLKKIKDECCDRSQEILNDLCANYPKIFKFELTNYFKQLDNNESRIFLQYINGFTLEFKSELLRELLFKNAKLEETYIGLIEILLSSHVKQDLLNKLIELMSNTAEEYSTHKSFGKLIFQVINNLGTNVLSLEQPLKHIIGTHKSVWKTKIQKSFDACFEHNLALTQSFRY